MSNGNLIAGYTGHCGSGVCDPGVRNCHSSLTHSLITSSNLSGCVTWASCTPWRPGGEGGCQFGEVLQANRKVKLKSCGTCVCGLTWKSSCQMRVETFFWVSSPVWIIIIILKQGSVTGDMKVVLSDGLPPRYPLKCTRVGLETPYWVQHMKKSARQNAQSKQTAIKSPYR